MKKRIRKVAILGSGTMGGGIAALLAAAGIRSYLLDIVPRELTDKEKAAQPEEVDKAVQLLYNKQEDQINVPLWWDVNPNGN